MSIEIKYSAVMRIDFALMPVFFSILSEKGIEINNILPDRLCLERAYVVLSGDALPAECIVTRWVDPLFSVNTCVKDGVEYRTYDIDWRPGEILPRGFYLDHLKKLVAEVEALDREQGRAV